MRGYTGSVALDCGGVFTGVTAPRGNLVTFWGLRTGSYISHTNFSDVCGISPTHTEGEFLMTSGIHGVANFMYTPERIILYSQALYQAGRGIIIFLQRGYYHRSFIIPLPQRYFLQQRIVKRSFEDEFVKPRAKDFTFHESSIFNLTYYHWYFFNKLVKSKYIEYFITVYRRRLWNKLAGCHKRGFPNHWSFRRDQR